MTGRPVRDWMVGHPLSTIYICIVVTAVLVIEILQVVGTLR